MSLLKIGDVMLSDGKVIPFLESRAWRELRYQILKLRGRRCECCGEDSPYAQFEVDHIKSRHKYPELRMEPKNLQVLCRPCNQGKGWQDETDWRVENLKKFIEMPND